MNLVPLVGFKQTVYPKQFLTADSIALSDLRKARVVIHLMNDPRVVEGPVIKRVVLKGDKLSFETGEFTFPENAKQIRVVSDRGTIYIGPELGDDIIVNTTISKLTFVVKLS